MRAIKTLFSKDSFVLILLFVLGIAGLWLFQLKQYSIFPSASIDLTLSKSEIQNLADNWATRFGYQKQLLIKSITFGCYDDSKTFLEYELGNSQADTLMRDTIPIFYWYCTFRKAFDQETMDITVSPTGKLTYLEYTLANDKKIPSINHKEAQQKAFALVKEITNWSEQNCKLVEDNTTARLNRTDHEFTWEYQKDDWHGARLRTNINLAGNLITGFNYYLYRPEKWDRDYSTIRTKNQLLESIASVFFFLLYPTSAFIFLRGISQGNIRWRFALGAASILTLISLIEDFNNIPVWVSRYTPDSSFLAFIIKSVIYPFLSAPFLFITVAAMAGAGEIIYRNLFPKKVALEKIFTLSGLRHREVLIGLIAGVTWFAVSLGYQICYYWIGKHFHFWCPLEVDNYKVLSTYFPWFSALNMGIFASTNEEILYRVLMLGLTRLLVRKFWLANLLQAAAWGFMHSTYPQQPCYARGLELTIEGVFDGWLLSRFGLLACIVSHYCFDAFQSVVPLFGAPTALKLSAAFPFIPLLLAMAYGFISNRKNIWRNEPLLNETITNVSPSTAQLSAANINSEFIYKPLSFKLRRLLLGVIAIGLILYPFIDKKVFSVGEEKRPLHTTRQQATKYAQDYLLSQHINSNDYKIATSLESGIDSGPALQYIFEQIGFEKTNKLIEQINAAFLWSVRFVKPLTPAEYCCFVNEDGQIRCLSVRRGEDEPGPNLKENEARAVAENYLRTQYHRYLPFQFEDISQTKRKNRTDYHITFIVPKYKISDADFKVYLDVIGDLPCNLGHFWDVPDAWTWEKTKQTKRQEVYSVVSAVTSAALSIALILWVLYLFKSGKVRWRLAMYLAGIACIGSVVSWLNNLPGFFNSYGTIVPINTFFITTAIGSITGLILSWVAATFGIAIVLAGIDETLKLQLKSIWLTMFSPKQNRMLLIQQKNLLLDAVLLTGFLGAASLLCGFVCNTIDLMLKKEVSMSYGSELFGIVDTFFGPLAIGKTMVENLVTGLLGVALAIIICRQLRLTRYWRFCSVAILFYLLCGLNMHYWQDSLAGLISLILMATLGWFTVRYVFNYNILSLFISIWIFTAYGFVYEFWKYGWPTFSKELIISSVFLLYPFIYLLYLYYSSYKVDSPSKLSS